MQPRDLFRRRRPHDDPPARDDDAAPDLTERTPTAETDGGAAPGSIRDRQKRRRDAARHQHEISAFLGTTPQVDDPELDADVDEDGDEEHDAPAPAVTGQVYVVFRSVEWSDGEGSLRESDSLVGVYATEDAARVAVVNLDRASRGEAEHWYQPYAISK